MRMRAYYNGLNPTLPDVAYIGVTVADRPYVVRTFHAQESIPRETLLWLEGILVVERSVAEKMFEFVHQD